MEKKLSTFICILFGIIFISCINIILKLKSDITHLISINILVGINITIAIVCLIIIKLIFKNSNLDEKKKFKENIQSAVANSFFISSLTSIISALIIYCFLKKILLFFKISEGIVNFTNFAAKTWFVSSPFIGLELVIFQYFSQIDIDKKIVITLLIKLIAYFSILGLFYIKFKTNSIIYAKPICDIFFLIYYTKICFDLTLKSLN